MELTLITFYDASTGAIIRVQPVELGEEAGHAMEGEGWLPGRVDGETHRIDPVTLEPAPLLEFDPVISLNRMDNIPAGTVAIFYDEKHPVDDGYLEWDVDFEETIDVRLWNPIYNSAIPAFQVPCA